MVPFLFNQGSQLVHQLEPIAHHNFTLLLFELKEFLLDWFKLSGLVYWFITLGLPLEMFHLLIQVFESLLDIELLNVEFELHGCLSLIEHVNRLKLFRKHSLSLLCLILERIANFISHHGMVIVEGFVLVHFLSSNFELRLEVLLEDFSETLCEYELVLP